MCTNRFKGWRLGVALVAALAVALVATRDAVASWPGANGKIAFERVGDIWVMDANGTNEVDLTSSAAVEATPSWSPRGDRIAFASNRDGDSELYVMQADGSGVVQVTKNISGDFDPAWAPDGQSLVFSSDRDGDREIYVKSLVTGKVDQVTHDSLTDRRPVWSPDGRLIAYIDEVSGGADSCDVRILAARDLDAKKDLSWLSADDFDSCTTLEDLAWAPGGKRLAVTWTGWDTPLHVGIQPLSGGLVWLLPWGLNSDCAGPTLGQVACWITKQAAWSPDGERVLFNANRLFLLADPLAEPDQAFPDLYTTAPSGSDLVRLTTSDVEENEPDWQPIPAELNPVTKSLRHALRRAFLRAHPVLDPTQVRGPLPGSVLAARFQGTAWALASFWRPQVGTRGQPELFNRPDGGHFTDLRRTWRKLCSVPVPVVFSWRLMAWRASC